MTDTHIMTRSSRFKAGIVGFVSSVCLTYTVLLALGASVHVKAQTPNAGKKAETEVKDRLSALRETVQQLTKVRDQISKEKLEWRRRKHAMVERMELLRAQIADFRKKTEVSRGKSGDTDKSTAELSGKLKQLDSGVDVLKDAIASLETKVRGLAPRLPAPASALVQPLLSAIPKDPKGTKLSLSQRYSFVTSFLDMVAQFHNKITVESELRSKKPGDKNEPKVSVTTVYFGCGQAFYASEKSEVAGIGTASKDDWVWVAKNDTKSVAAIRKLIAIVRGGEGAAFVPVPVVIK